MFGFTFLCVFNAYHFWGFDDKDTLISKENTAPKVSSEAAFFFFLLMPVSSAKLALLLVTLSEFGAWFSIVAVTNWHAVS